MWVRKNGHHREKENAATLKSITQKIVATGSHLSNHIKGRVTDDIAARNTPVQMMYTVEVAVIPSCCSRTLRAYFDCDVITEQNKSYWQPKGPGFN